MLDSLSIQHKGKNEAAREKNIEKTREIKLLLQPPSRSNEAGGRQLRTMERETARVRPIVPSFRGLGL
jgi:hypothetical protein